jgi:hypothetical protein
LNPVALIFCVERVPRGFVVAWNTRDATNFLVPTAWGPVDLHCAKVEEQVSAPDVEPDDLHAMVLVLVSVD